MPSSTALRPRAWQSPWLSSWRSSWLRPLNDLGAIERLLQRFVPTASLRSVRARVIKLEAEPGNAISLWLQPNSRWRGHRAGQHVLIDLDVDGVRRCRAFSIASAPGDGQPLQLTVRGNAQGRVSDWLQHGLRPGQVLGLSQAQGEFLLPAEIPAKLVLVAGGSGITPLLAMLRQLARQAHVGDIVLLQSERGAERRLFASELQQLSTQLPGLRVIFHDSRAAGRIDRARLLRLLPDLAERYALVCGPAALMQVIKGLYMEFGLPGQVQQEAYAAAAPLAPAAASDTDAACQVTCTESKQLFTVSASDSLLMAAERAGLQPPYGCRAGICRTCLCYKRRGRVRNLLTGQVSDHPDEWLQLCISSAESDLELEL